MKAKYLECIKNSEKVSWRIEDLITPDYRFDFGKRFLPQAMTPEKKLPFLSEPERLDLNHVSSASYINLFAFVEEYITAFMVRLASEETLGNNERLRALLRFSEEEVKHQTLFTRYVELFNKQFKTDCQFLSNADEVANIILSNSELGVLLLTYHLEIITQQHYIESIRDNQSLDENFSLILKKHWQEEAQHAKLDLYELQRLSKQCSEEEFLRSMAEYFNIVEAFTGLLRKQAELDFDSLSSCSNRVWQPHEKRNFLQAQHGSYFNNFILMGLKNEVFRAEIKALCPSAMAFFDEKINSLEGAVIRGFNAA